MTLQSEMPTETRPSPEPEPEQSSKAGMSTVKKVGLLAVGVYILGFVLIIATWGLSGTKNEEFNIVQPFHLDRWFKIVGPVEFNKGVLYLLLTTAVTLGILLWVAKKMTMRPNRVQTAVEAFYDLIRSMTRDNMDERLAKKWFPLVGTLFVFILVTNLLGYIPLPVNSAEKIFGGKFPSFQLYAADTNVAVPLILALGVWLVFNYEGVKAHGPIGYIKSLVPSGVSKGMLFMLYPLEMLSNFLRLLSLTVRLWANLLAGHLLIDFMGGNMAVLLGRPYLGWLTLPLGIAIYLFEAVLIAGLQAFIFAILTAMYIGSATHSH
ncbi:MAG TPA: F0F1 ATP synthase subunit A [Sporichthyaceae bacterium]|jgi:F-type H+-transporting ATPase subunit a